MRYTRDYGKLENEAGTDKRVGLIGRQARNETSRHVVGAGKGKLKAGAIRTALHRDASLSKLNLLVYVSIPFHHYFY